MNNSINQVGRNISHIRDLAREFLTQRVSDELDFLLYIAFHDPHRCGHTEPQFGNFCQKFGDGSSPEMGSIEDWNPSYYDPADVIVPDFIQDTPAARQDIADQYTTLSRMDQGINYLIRTVQVNGYAFHVTLFCGIPTWIQYVPAVHILEFFTGNIIFNFQE